MTRFIQVPYELRYAREQVRQSEKRLDRVTKLKEKWHKKAKELESENEKLKRSITEHICSCGRDFYG